MGSARRFVIDRIDSCGLQAVAEVLGPFRMFFRTDAQEEDVYLVVECLAIFEYTAVHGIKLLQIDAACSAKSADISKFIQIVQGGVESKIGRASCRERV